MSKQASRPRSASGNAGDRAPRGGSKAGAKSPATSSGKGAKASTAREHAALSAAVGGRENEFRGIAIVVAGVLAALGVYLNVAGPVGDGIDTALGWVLGLGRFLLPPTLIALGVVVIRRNESEHRLRIAVGSVVIVLSALGLLHLARGEGRMTASVDALKPAGGWVGALIGQPLRAMLSVVGAVVVLLAIALGGVLIVTGMSLPLLIKRLRGHFTTVAAPTARAAKKMLSEIQTVGDDQLVLQRCYGVVRVQMSSLRGTLALKVSILLVESCGEFLLECPPFDFICVGLNVLPSRLLYKSTPMR